MQIFNSPNKKENLAVALGFFDGVHIAHKTLLKKAVSLAKENGVKSAAVTFVESPGGYFDPKKKIRLQTLEDRLELISKTGVDFAYVLNFENYKTLSAKEYLYDVLIKNFNPKFIVAGFNHTFGQNRLGNGEFLRENEGTYKYIEIDKMRLNNTLVSSTNIKKFIEKGYIKEANALLGYDFNVSGMVVEGLKLAQKIGFKTANLEWDENLVMPPFGVYFAQAEYGGRILPCVVNFGVKPTVDTFKKPILEAHIFDFDKNIYGEKLKVYFKAPIRAEEKFSSLEELKAAIQKDIIKCKEYI